MIKLTLLEPREKIVSNLKVRLDEAVVQKVASEDGNFISKEDFIKVCQDLKLLDFGGPMGEKRKTLATPRKERRLTETDSEANVSSNQKTCLALVPFYSLPITLNC